MLRVVTLAALLTVSSAMVLADAQSGKAERTQTGTAKITAIDHKARTVTLKYTDGTEDTFSVGPAVSRFDQLKTGDTIRATYVESLVFEVRKPGSTAPAQVAAAAGGRLKDTPGGAVGTVQTATVTVKAIDMAASHLTVTTKDGHTITRKIENKQHLEGLKVGDTVDITYSQALIVNAEAAK